MNYADYGAESGRYVHELTDTVTPNIGMRYGLSDAGGYEPVPLKSATTIEGLLRQAVSSQSPAVVAMASMMNVGTVIMPVGLSTHIPSLAVLKSRKSVFDVAPSPPRQVVVYGHTRVVPDLQRTARVLGTTGFPYGSVAIVSRSTGLPEGMACPAAPIRYRDLSWRPAHGGGDCKIAGLETRGLVAISVSALPGWKASVDGVSVPPLRVNGAFLGVVAPPGDHTVRVRYQPTAFRVGLFLTLIGLLSLAALGTAGAIVMPRGEGKLGSSRTT